MEWINQYFHEVDGFTRPDWPAIYDAIEMEHKDVDQHDLWCEIARAWMNRLVSCLPAGYSIHESDNFIIVTTESDKYVTIFQDFLERTLKRIMNTLQGVASDEGYGKYIVLVFDDIDHYYAYLSYFYEADGVYGQSSGIYLNKGYGHFALPHQDLTYVESVTAHEMTHALLSHLPIPVWLNEGMAVAIEDLLTGSAPLRMDSELMARHQAFWNKETIQEFWSGDAFHRPDEGQALSYHLAQMAVNSLSHDYDTFKAFVNRAHFGDGGEAAANEVYEGSLGDLISQYFGEGEWVPDPETWDAIGNGSIDRDSTDQADD